MSLYSKVKKWIMIENVIYVISSILLFFSIIVVSLSLYFNNESGTWFARSGSIMVLFAVIVEYYLSFVKTYENSSNVFTNSKPNMTKRNMPFKYKFLKYIAHIFIVFGTLIWGYGDCMTALESNCY
ncbi:MAG: hypothetical protein EOM78_20740 [Erysipelotrichia bacterium]|nr:hypothetical protein [Erysipelotrichia bacterium]